MHSFCHQDKTASEYGISRPYSQFVERNQYQPRPTEAGSYYEVGLYKAVQYISDPQLQIC